MKGILKRLGLSEYREMFDREEIDLEALKELSEDDLVELGVKRGDIGALSAVIKELKQVKV